MPIKLLLFLLLAPVSLTAAEITVRFICSTSMVGNDKYELVSNKEHSKPFTLPTNFISPKMSVSTRSLALVPAKNSKGTLRCNISLPESGKDFIIVVSPTADSFEASVLRTDDRTFKPGDVFILNSSSHTVRGTLGTTKFEIEPESGDTISAVAGSDTKDLKVEIFYLKDEEEQLLSKSAWPIEANIRSYLFFFTGKHDHPDYRAVDEFVNPSH